MKKIVYVMNVEWNWIKQRPHFIAEELAQDNDVTIMYRYRYNRRGLQKRTTQGHKICPIFVIPLGDRFNFLRKINRWIIKLSIRYQIAKQKAEILYLTFPDQFDAVPPSFTGKVIYDCMDNHAAFVDDPAMRKKIEQQEAALIERADNVLISSQKLGQVLLERYGDCYSSKLTLVRNGYNGQQLPLKQIKTPSEETTFTVAYFGTISSWFNFDFLLRSLDDFPNLHYLLIGPADVEIPQAQRLSYIGTVEHSNLKNAINDAKCLMMPFVVNEVIESVDPVKLYEYINFNRDILCIKYPEVERFEPYVYFYEDYPSFCSQLKQLMHAKNVKYSAQEREEFLKQNSWAERANVIRTLF